MLTKYHIELYNQESTVVPLENGKEILEQSRAEVNDNILDSWSNIN